MRVARAVAPRSAGSWLTSPLAASVVLAFFYVLMLASLRDKSVTADEIAHATAGYSYWRFNDYRFNPENGNLPQRIMGLPLWLSGTHFPSTETEEWRTSNEWIFGYRWFHHMGNDVASLLATGRAAMGLVTVALGALVWAWSRRLFGPAAAMMSLLLFVLNPTVLANGALMTSDATAALFFLAATTGVWAVLHRITPTRVFVSALLTGGLFVAKMSAPLIVPIAFALAAVRIAEGSPLPLVLGRTRARVSRAQQTLAILAVVAVHVVVAWVVVWGFFGFRYSAFADNAKNAEHAQEWGMVLGRPDPLSLIGPEIKLSPEQNARLAQLLDTLSLPSTAWAPARLAAMVTIRKEILSPEQNQQLDRALDEPLNAATARLADFARKYRLLPEAFLYGNAHAWKFSQVRSAFLNGEVRLTGWRTFFPYTFLVKTPLSFLALLVLAACALGYLRHLPSAAHAERSVGYEILPLAVLFVAYWSAVLTSHLNIGHRHLLVIYSPLFVLGGAAALWLGRWSDATTGVSRRWQRPAAIAVVVLLAALAAETFDRFPNYLAYFNAVAGGPAHGYRHLVDSSLDWGQELPAIKAYVEKAAVSGPVYLSYFGNGSPDYYHVPARYLYANESPDVLPPMQILSLPAAKAEAMANDFLRQHPDFSIAGSARGMDGSVGVVVLKDPDEFRLLPGVYLISASMLQPLMYDLSGPLGPWNERFEKTYQELLRDARPFLQNDPNVRLAALRTRRASEWAKLLKRFDTYRFARLTAWLRKRQPDDTVNFSVLVYRLTDADLASALDGPAPELGVDVPAAHERALAAASKNVRHSP